MRKIVSVGLVGLACVAANTRSASSGDGHRGKAKPERPNTLEQVARSVDALEENILDDGTVVLKQPDVYSQSRMTLYRKNFEQQLFKAIDQFNVVLSARVFRSDQAGFLSQGNLATAAGQAMSKGSGTAGATQTVVTPPPLVNAGNGPGITPNGFAPGTISRPDSLTSFGAVPFAQGFSQPGNSYGLGVEPTVYLDQLKRYQDHLNEIRRVNMGDDIADSAGYGLHLIRMPISIQPGECTRKGYGAVLTATARHSFGSNFLYQTYRNLVINDLVDQLTPVVFEMIRSDGPNRLAGLVDSRDLFDRYGYAKQSRNLQFDTYSYKSGADIQAQIEKDLDRLSLASPSAGAASSAYAPSPSSREAIKRKDPRSRVNTTGALEITRLNERDYPIPPSELGNIFFTQNLYALALAARQGMQTVTPKASDVRVFLRRELETAYDIVTQLYADQDPNQPAIIDQFERSVEEIAAHVRNLEYDKLEDDYRDLARVLPGKYRYTDGPRQLDRAEYDWLAGRMIDIPALERDNPNYFHEVDPNYSLVQELTILTYAIGIESGLLNNQLRLDMKRVFSKAGQDCSAVDSARFFAARPTPDAEAIFQDYVKQRWRIITFALDPVVDQQNIADASSARRDLQLAFAFAFSTGQINFQQLNQYQRRIEVDSEAISLNRTVTSFAHGNDTFGFRFLPRYQSAPPQKSNLQVIGSQLLGNGGLGPNYQLKNSKLEAGQRELSVVVIMPSFLQGIEMDVTGNWFPLNDPDQMKIHTPRMIEQGRQVVELQESLACIHDHAKYRPGDIQRLTTRVHQIESMLPMQTYDVAVPFENTLGGFQLFQQGITALVPQLDSFEGAEAIKQGQSTDLVLYGKHFSIQETNVIAGGAYLINDNLDVRNVVQVATTTPAATTTTTPAATTVATPAAAATPATTSMLRGPSGALRRASFQTTDTTTTATPALTPPTQTPVANTATIGPATTYVTAVTNTAPASSTTTVNNAAIDIVSREVMRITIPATVTPTQVYDADKQKYKTYVEVYVATPTGISNRLLIPYVPSSTTPEPSPVAFDLGANAASELDVSYQWLEGRDGKPALVATKDPGAAGLKITWDSPVGLAPRSLLATFHVALDGQSIAFALPANSGLKDDYSVDQRQLTLMLLERLEAAYPFPKPLPASLSMTVSVQPWIPRETMGYRVRTAPKALKTPLTVKFTTLITNVDALDGVQITPVPAPPAGDDKSASARPAPSADPAAVARIRGQIDQAVRRASTPATGRPRAPAGPTMRTPASPRPTIRPAETPTIRDPMARRTSAGPADILILPPLPTTPPPAEGRKWFGWVPPWRRGDR